MSNFLYTLLQDIRSGDILAMIEELEEAIPVVSRTALASPLIHLLQQFTYPQGPEKRVPINPSAALNTPILESKVGKLPDGDLRDLCHELAKLSNKGLEFYQGSKVFALLNKTLPRREAPKKPTALQGRRTAVDQQRRANRRQR